eukprot:UN1558
MVVLAAWRLWLAAELLAVARGGAVEDSCGVADEDTCAMYAKTPEKPNATIYDDVIQDILAKRASPESDPFWEEVLDKIRVLAPRDQTFPWGRVMQLCQAGDLDRYVSEACSLPEASIPVFGHDSDSYFCGSPDISFWNYSWYPPVTSICSAKPGSAYAPDGHCGKHSGRTLAVNFATTWPLWTKVIWSVNVQSLDCILGLGDCDIIYCKKCRNHCPKAEE